MYSLIEAWDSPVNTALFVKKQHEKQGAGQKQSIVSKINQIHFNNNGHNLYNNLECPEKEKSTVVLANKH